MSIGELQNILMDYIQFKKVSPLFSDKDLHRMDKFILNHSNLVDSLSTVPLLTKLVKYY